MSVLVTYTCDKCGKEIEGVDRFKIQTLNWKYKIKTYHYCKEDFKKLEETL